MHKSKDPPILQMRNVSKTFAGIQALTQVNLDVRAGEVHALMGENGAGKSTLMKVLSGAYQPDPGSEIIIDGAPTKIDGPKAGLSAGISVIYQELSLAPNLTVAENIYLGREMTKAGFASRREMHSAVLPVLAKLGIDLDPATTIDRLSLGQRQLVEIARALHARARILVMDEPTAALSAGDTERLFAIVRQLRAEGMAIVYISHRMDEVYALADRVTVLRDGSFVAALENSEINAETIVRLMVGREVSSFYKKQHRFERGHAALGLVVTDLAADSASTGCSFSVYAGEVLGLAGLIGSGRTELARLIFAAEPAAKGTVEVHGIKTRLKGPGDAAASGVAYLTEDRGEQGLFLDMTCGENINLSVLGQDATAGFIDFKKARERSADAFKRLRIRAAHPDVLVGALSGGNQQKVLLSRLLTSDPKVLILDEPTRGIDVGAKSEIYSIIDSLAKAGTAILVISSDLPEIIGICDRALVMRDGEIVGEVGPGSDLDITQENIIALATGAISLTHSQTAREGHHHDDGA